MVIRKKHPLKGRKQNPETIAKRMATLAEKKRLREAGELPPPKRKYNKRVDPRTFEQLQRDVKEAAWCLEKAIAGKRRDIATGQASITDVTDEETFMYMAMRYLQGGLR